MTTFEFPNSMMYVLENGVPRPAEDLDEYIEFMRKSEEDLFHRAVAKTVMWNGYLKIEVSTMFLGSDINFSFEGTPVCYESMSFYRGGPPEDSFDEFDSMFRYSTPEEAAGGHQTMIEDIKNHFAERFYDPNKWDISTVIGEAHPDMWKDKK